MTITAQHPFRFALHSGSRSFLSLIIPLLLLGGFAVSGCGPAPFISKSFFAGERPRVSAYYDLRRMGMPFDHRFYDQSDSIRASLSVHNQSLLKAYDEIAWMRQRDSLNLWSANDYKYNAQLIDDNFYFAQGEAK